ncbi:MAG: choice-of-anchor D domain-containing protein [Bacteroidia bacterium]|nr:MAG: choice-of-anchor D domain-containing protein [Bacteroidia bacterium]
MLFSKINLKKNPVKHFFTIVFIILPLLAITQSEYTSLPAHNYFNENTEVYYSFPVPEPEILQELFHIVSIDKIRPDSVYAYANSREFDLFLTYTIPYTMLQRPGMVEFDVNMKTWDELKNRDLTESWDFYPTYEAYVALMYSFEQDYPDMVEIINIGETVMGRDLLFARISPDIDKKRAVPQFMYTSTMHGDETAGFILSLRLIHYLLTNYGEDEAITSLMDNVDIWICPNENPDGTYTNNNSTVSGATRGNANGIDLNRNYPNPVNNPWQPQQPETTAMISFTDTINFIMSANMHGGIELVNFPFDSWISSVNTHADHDWWEFVMYEYVDTVHAHSPPGYMTGMGDGVTHGGDWYVIYGSRQDYFNYYRSCREFTLELSNQKLLAPHLLPAHWEYNYRSLLNYIRQSIYGVHGIVYDNETGQPLLAEISIPGYDSDNSEVFTSLPHGNYNRPLLTGSYNMLFSAEGFDPVSINGVQAVNYERTRLNVALGEDVSGEVLAVSISLDGEGEVHPFEGEQLFNHGANLFLVAIPAEGWTFEEWIVNGAYYPEENLVYTLTEDTDVLAVFTEHETVSEIAVIPGEMHFGEGVIGQVHSKNLRILNTGDADLTINTISLEGDDVFFMDDPVFRSKMLIPPGNEESVTFYFQPEAEQEYTADIFIESNDPENPIIDIPVSGSGVHEAAIIKLSADTMDFGNVHVNESLAKELTVTNDGNLSLTIESVELDDTLPFTINGIDFPLTLEPGQSQVFIVTFSPLLSGIKSGIAVFQSNAGNNPEYSFYLTGNGFDPTSVHDIHARSVSLEVFPNPIRHNTSVVLNMEEAQSVRLVLFDMQGRLRAVIHDGKLTAGEHIFELSVIYHRLEQGVYVLSAQTSLSQHTLRMIK